MSKNHKPIEIHQQLGGVQKIMSEDGVRQWCIIFVNGHTSAHDEWWSEHCDWWTDSGKRWKYSWKLPFQNYRGLTSVSSNFTKIVIRIYDSIARL